jgi:hypothetical protein
MMPSAEAAKLADSRGFVDVNPRNVWADWHRVRPQLLGGYLPRIILCIPGDGDLRERCEPILRAANVEHEFRPHDPSMLAAFRASSMTWPVFTPEDFDRIDAHTTVLFALSKPVVSGAARSVGVTFLDLGKQLLDAGGGIAIKCEGAGISHSRRRWFEFAQGAARDPEQAWSALFHAFVVYPIGTPTDLYSCGMHLLGAPDMIVSEAVVELANGPGGSAVGVAAHLFRTFGLYLLGECPTGRFASGHTFSVDKDAPRYRVVWEACTGYPEDSYFFNPFGRWRFTLI